MLKKVGNEIVNPSIALLRGLFQLADRNYIKNKLAKRRGKCKKCGECCKGCIFLNKRTNLCKIYTNRPRLFCYKEFPLDKLDQKIWGVEGKCGYSFLEPARH